MSIDVPVPKTADEQIGKRRKCLLDFFDNAKDLKKRKQMQQQKHTKVKKDVKSKKCMPIRHNNNTKRRQHTKRRSKVQGAKREPPKLFYTPPHTDVRQRNIPPITVSKRKRIVKPDLAAAISAANVAATKMKQKADKEKAAEETRHSAQENVEEAKRNNNKEVEKKSMAELVSNILNLHTNKSVGAYYKILAVESTASLDDIKKAYKKLALKLHPDKDKYSTPNIEEAFKVVGNIYELLTDSVTRKRYDDGESKRQQQKQKQKTTPSFLCIISMSILAENRRETRRKGVFISIRAS